MDKDNMLENVAGMYQESSNQWFAWAEATAWLGNPAK